MLAVSRITSKRFHHADGYPDTEQARARVRTVPFKQTRAELVSHTVSLNQRAPDSVIENAGMARLCFVTGHLEEMARDGTDNTENLNVS